jgi:hypothetical protein
VANRKRSGQESLALSAKGAGDASAGVRFDTAGAPLYGGAMEQFLEVLLKPDNIPIAGMLLLVLFFTWVGLRQAIRNDRLAEQGREDEILKEMQR